MSIVILAILTMVVNTTGSNVTLINNTSNLNNASIACKKILSFLEDNDGLYTDTDVSDTSIKSRGNTRYIIYDSQKKALFINEDGNTTESNTPIILDNLKFTLYKSSKDQYFIIINITNGNTVINTAYPVSLR